MNPFQFILPQQGAPMRPCCNANADENAQASCPGKKSSPSRHSWLRPWVETEIRNPKQFRNGKPPFILIVLLLIAFSRPAVLSTLADGSGLLNLVVRVQNQDGTGLSGIYVRHIVPEESLQHLMKDRIRLMKYYYSGSVTAGNDSGVAVVPVYARFGYQDDKFLGAAAGGSLVLVHPHDGATTLAFDDDKIQWQWSEALGSPVAYLGLVYDETKKKWKVVP